MKRVSMTALVAAAFILASTSGSARVIPKPSIPRRPFSLKNLAAGDSRTEVIRKAETLCACGALEDCGKESTPSDFIVELGYSSFLGARFS